MLISLNLGESLARAASQDKCWFFSDENSTEVEARSESVWAEEIFEVTTLELLPSTLPKTNSLPLKNGEKILSF